MNTSSPAEVRKRANVVLWLLTGCLLIFIMVIIGGITRLTGSGLSITEWKVVTGTLPPLNEDQWLKEFHLYMDSPQFKLINSHFGLEEFKEIYWWEYIHRLLGRLIGLVFVIPFIWFLITKQLSRPMVWKSLILFFMGALQGFIGWYMVKSGLVDRPSVSHLRLALHLSTAFATFGLTFWFALGLLDTQRIQPGPELRKMRTGIWIVFVILVAQIVYGAFVAGLKAGLIYNTWPMMEGSWVAGSVTYAWEQMGWLALRDNMAMVQFIHRNLAIIFVIAFEVLYWRSRKYSVLSSKQKFAFQLVTAATVLQFTLGVITLLLAVPVFMGVIHQAGAFLLLTAMIYLVHCLYKQPLSVARV
jgi:cytochrome c oxidase assembly protein subunit 15